MSTLIHPVSNESVLIETLATGDEVVNGDVVDSNSARISQALAKWGLPVQRHQALPDHESLLLEGIRAISERADVCIASGGLGPTEDDLTADIVAKLLGVEVLIDELAVERMKERFAKSGYRFSENNRRSARYPAGAEVRQNEVGTAPAFTIRIGRCQFFFLPGVPSEFDFFVKDFVLPWIQASWPEGSTVTVQLKTLHWGESHLAEAFQDYSRLFPKVRLGYRAHAPEVWLKLTASGASRDAALRSLEPAIDEALRRVGDTVFGRDEEELNQVVHRLLTERKVTLSTAESCTGGLTAQQITLLPGSSAYFLGGVVSYSNDLKEKLLGVPAETLEKYGAVSPQVAKAMALGALERLGSDLAVSITGVAGPSGGTPEKPVGLVQLAIAGTLGKNGKRVKPWVHSVECRFRGGRERIQRASAWTALDLIRRVLQDVEIPKQLGIR